MLSKSLVPAFILSILPAICEAQLSYVIPPGFEEVEGDSFTGGYPEGFHFQQLANADWFGDLPNGPQLIERISLRPKFSVTEPLDLQESQLKIRLSTTPLEELGLVYEGNHGSDVRTMFEGPAGIVSQATSTNGVTRDFDVHFDFAEPFVYDRTQGNLVFDLE